MTHVTLVIEGGSDVKTAQTLARHATPEMTMNIYAKARNERLTAAVEKLGNMIRNGENAIGGNEIPTKRKTAIS